MLTPEARAAFRERMRRALKRLPDPSDAYLDRAARHRAAEKLRAAREQVSRRDDERRAG